MSKKKQRRCSNILPIICGIYKIISPSGKVYIGQSDDIYSRWKCYEDLHCKSQPRLYSSLNKYGYKLHQKIIIEECEVNKLNERERYWQEYYEVIDKYKGLNCKYIDTKEKRTVVSEETKKKIGDGNRGKKCSLQTIEKIRKIWLGKTHTEETKKRMSESAKGRSRSEKQRKHHSEIQRGKKPIIQLTLNDNFIKEWDSLALIKEELGYSSSCIQVVCDKKLKGGYIRKQMYGYKWIRKSEYLNLIKNEE